MRRLWLTIGLGALLVVGLMLALQSAQPVRAGNLEVFPTCSFLSIQEAIDAAGPGDTIRVAQGVYTENITVDKEVTLEGGYESVSWTRNPTEHETIIDGGGVGSVVGFVEGSNGAVLDGFTVRNGEAEVGGGIYISGASPTIKQCLIVNNHADAGAGLAIDEGATPLITDNEIVSNTASCCGGGIRVSKSGGTIQNNRILSNTAQSWAGGGVEIAVEAWTAVVGNSIIGNIANTGGGIAVNWYSTVTVAGNEIVSNRADGTGGVYVNEYSNAALDRNMIANNMSHGVAVYYSVVTMTNNIVSGNSGNGLEVGHSEVSLVNNTIVMNATEGLFVHQSDVTLQNNIVVSNRNCGVNTWSGGWPSTATFSHNNFWDNAPEDYCEWGPGPGDISVDPLFVDGVNGDYHLQLGSPCIDAGTNLGSPSADFDGNSRPDGCWVDIGADELDRGRSCYHVYLPLVQR